MAEQAYLRLRGVSKSYGAIKALSKVDLDIGKATIHAILGENGAGKSTLIKILAGVTEADEGTIELEGETLALKSPHEATETGVVCVFQELSLVPHLTVAENISLSAPPVTRAGFLRRGAAREVAREMLTRMGCSPIDLDARCADLPLAKQQLVEIAKALYLQPRVLILDEATSALASEDVRHLFDLLRRLKASGVTILFVSHRMREIEEIADNCSILRNGEHVETFEAGSRDRDEQIRMMIGRSIQQIYPAKPPADFSSTPRLSLRGLSWGKTFSGISFDLRPGQIVGLGGLDGQGQNELLLALFGVLRGVTGELQLEGKAFRPQPPSRAKKLASALALVPEERKTEGVLIEMSIKDNLTLAALPKLCRGGLIQHQEERALLERLVQRLQIRAPDLDLPVWSLSGGNQQKVAIAKWIAIAPKVLLLNDPTRGVDVGTKQQIYLLLRELAAEGLSILFYSTDYDELIGLCDEVHVFYGGRIGASLSGDSLDEESLLHATMGGRGTGTASLEGALQ